MSEVFNGEKIPTKERPELNKSESEKLKKSNMKEYSPYLFNNNTSTNNKNNNTNIDTFPEVLDIPRQINQEKIRQTQEKEKIISYIKKPRKTCTNHILCIFWHI